MIEQYVYFISYWHAKGNEQGFGNVELFRSAPITHHTDIVMTTELLERQGMVAGHKVVILGYSLLRKEAFTPCGERGEWAVVE